MFGFLKPFRHLLLLLLVMLLPVSARAQAEPALVMPWTEFPGLFERRANGTPGGYSADLARLVTAEAGLDLEFRHYDTAAEVLAAQAQGDTDMLAGIFRSAMLSDSNVFSVPVARGSIELFMRSEEVTAGVLEELRDRRIAVAAPSDASITGPLADRNEVVVYNDPQAAFGALLIGAVDGVVSARKVATDLLRSVHMDHRVRSAGPALAERDYHVALHSGRADLLPRIDAAIDRLETSGRMQRLREAGNITRPDPVPEVLVVGVTHFPPYQVVTEEGEFTGFGVEALRDLAERAGLDLSYKQISPEMWGLGPGPGGYDILPPISVDPSRRARMDFTTAIQQSPYSIFTRAGESEGISDLDSLAGRRVGVTAQNVARAEAEAHGGFEVVTFDSAERLLDGLREGEVDAILYPLMTVRRMAAAGGFEDEIAEVSPPFFVTERAIALRRGLGPVRESLNAVIPGYLSTPDYAELREAWLGEPDFWTPERQRQAMIGAAVLVFLIALAFLVQNILARRKAEGLAAETRAVSNRLGAILDAARSGIIGLTADGQVGAINPGGREMLGATGTPVPFPWPGGTAFVAPEGEDRPSRERDPIRRALAGEVLRGETALLRREDAAAPLYLRVSSAPVNEQAAGGIATVLILDDITEQERNRQQMERSSRLDALGQLTGGVAHDFNNILATIEYAMQLVRADVPDRTMPFLETAQASVRRGAELTRRLLAFAKRQPGVESSVSTGEVLADFRDLAAPAIEKSITLDFQDEGGDLYVYCDIAQLENALLNLVLNSRDAIMQAGKGDRITVKVKGLDDAGPIGGEEGLRYVDFTVTDNGPGMSAEVQRRATDPFFTTKDQNSGTGLGLSMVYGFVEQSRGVLRLYSEPGLGTTVRMILPRGAARDRREGVHKRVPVPAGKGQRILVVEDEESLLDIVTEILRSLSYEVVQARSGREALDLVDGKEPFDLLLTDIVMPGGIGGFKLASEVRARRPDVPVIYMSGYSGILESEMGDVVAPTLQKPCPPLELATALRDALGG